ncbi:MAG: hypothetical protein LIR46_02980 [Bacteroidota bacterium]|nr:hypothetical protein [Bacteroidota bacterium]
MARLISFMFERFKKIASKATDNAVEGVKKSLSDRFEKYGDIFFAGLAIGTIVIGSHHLMKSSMKNQPQYLPYPTGNGQQPIIINNYYYEREREVYSRGRNQERRNCYIDPNGRMVQGTSQKTYKKR